MNKFAKIAMVASALLIPQIAHAAPPSGVLTGVVDVHKGISLTCDVTLNISGSTATIALTPGDPLCAALSFNSQPYTTSFDSATGTFTVHDVDVSTITLGGCFGDISGHWDGTTLEIDAVIPAANGGGDCTVVGFAE